MAQSAKVNKKDLELKVEVANNMIKKVMRLLAEVHQTSGPGDVILRMEIMKDVSSFLGRPLEPAGIECRIPADLLPKIGTHFSKCPRCVAGRYQLNTAHGIVWVDCLNCAEGSRLGLSGYMAVKDVRRILLGGKGMMPEAIPTVLQEQINASLKTADISTEDEGSSVDQDF